MLEHFTLNIIALALKAFRSVPVWYYTLRLDLGLPVDFRMTVQCALCVQPVQIASVWRRLKVFILLNVFPNACKMSKLGT